MQDNSPKKTVKSFAKSIRRIYVVSFIVIVSIGLGVSVKILEGILQQSGTDTNNNTGQITITNTIPDQSMTDQLNQLSSSDNASTPSLPSGRINPFSE